MERKKGQCRAPIAGSVANKSGQGGGLSLCWHRIGCIRTLLSSRVQHGARGWGRWTMDDGRQGDQEATGSLLGLFEDGTGYGVQDRQLDWIAFRVS